MDEAALRSAYWSDGTDQHGPYLGSVQGFVAMILKSLEGVGRVVHQIHNILIEFRDGGAAVESYFTASHWEDKTGAMRQRNTIGRYVDWFEKRGDEWRVKNRTVVYDLIYELNLPDLAEAERFGSRLPLGARFPHDLVYQQQ